MSDLDAKLRASLREALPCRCGGIPRGGAGHFSTCPAESCEDVLAALAPIIAEAQRDTERLREALEWIRDAAERPVCICGVITGTAALKSHATRALAEARTPEAGDGE